MAVECWGSVWGVLAAKGMGAPAVAVRVGVMAASEEVGVTSGPADQMAAGKARWATAEARPEAVGAEAAAMW